MNMSRVVQNRLYNSVFGHCGSGTSAEMVVSTKGHVDFLPARY